MRTLRTRRATDETGSTMVEFALVSIVAFLLMVTMAELAMVVLGKSTGSNAARDGARVGLVYYRDADVSGSANNTKIVTAVQKHLASNVENVTITVRCLIGDGTFAQLTACNPTYVDLTRRDLIEVEARWHHKGFGPFMPTLSQSSTARMVISGEPDLTVVTPPPAPVAAGPVPVSMSDITNGATDGKPEAGDAWRVTFSEPLSPTWTSGTTVNVVFTRGSSPSDTTFIDIPNVSSGSFDTGGKYNLVGSTVTFSSTLTVSGTNLTVTLGSCNTGCSSTIADKGEFTYTPSPTIKDLAGGVAGGTLSSGNNYRLF